MKECWGGYVWNDKAEGLEYSLRKFYVVGFRDLEENVVIIVVYGISTNSLTFLSKDGAEFLSLLVG